jgi:hypothetical protein
MSEPLPPRDDDLHLTLQLELRLRRSGLESGWSGEVSAPGRGERLSFATLPALIAWIARLEPQPPSSGLR